MSSDKESSVLDEPPRPTVKMRNLPQDLHADTYMSRLDIVDHIRPIWERDEVIVEKTEAPEEAFLEYTYSLPKFIERASIVTEESVSSHSSEAISDFALLDIEEHDVRGIDLEDIQWNTVRSQLDDSEIHRISINGTPMHAQILECFDLSPYADQFPIFHYEWFIGIDYDGSERYAPYPVATGKYLRVPLEAIGKYIFCRAHRKIEAQVHDYNEPIDNMYDPHIDAPLRRSESQARVITNMSSVGPVDISNEWALLFIQSLDSKHFSINVELLIQEPLKPILSFKVHLHLGYDFVMIKCDDAIKQAELAQILAAGQSESGEVSIEYDSLSVEDNGSTEPELLLYPGDRLPEDTLASIKLRDKAQCVLVFYTFKLFIARMSMDRESIHIDKQLKETDVDYIKKLVRKLLENT